MYFELVYILNILLSVGRRGSPDVLGRIAPPLLSQEANRSSLGAQAAMCQLKTNPARYLTLPWYLKALRRKGSELVLNDTAGCKSKEEFKKGLEQALRTVFRFVKEDDSARQDSGVTLKIGR